MMNARTVLALLVGGIAAVACGAGEPRTDAERLARGREIVERMSAKLAAARAFSVTTTEVRHEAKSNGQVVPFTLTRQTIVQRPNHFYTKVSGDRDNEVWYDGIGITVVMHNEKAFGQARAPETLDKTLDAMHERYGVAAPIGDYVYSSPAKALLTPSTTGGWVAREDVNGRATDHLAFKDTGVAWELWIPADGDPLPQKAIAEFTTDKRLRKVELGFKDWNLAPTIEAARFQPHVPGDYEGIAIVQRARVLKNQPKDEPAATTGSKEKSRP